MQHISAKPEMMLWLSDARGVYIPRDFAGSFVDRDKHVSGVKPDDWAILEAGPDHEWYWEAWTGICDSAIVTDENGYKYRLWQEGDLWLIPEGMEWDDRNETFDWPKEDNEPDYEHEDKLDR